MSAVAQFQIFYPRDGLFSRYRQACS